MDDCAPPMTATRRHRPDTPAPVAPAALHTPSIVAPLADVVVEARQVQELVEECRGDLAEVHACMQQDLEDPRVESTTADTLQKSVEVQAKVETVSDKVATITEDLVEQVRDRRLLDLQFAAAVEQEAAARRAAVHDRLTGLPNRALLEDRIQHGLAQAKRHGWGMGVLFIDLDAFKQINDTLGHAGGDRLLVSIAQRLLKHARSDDTVARYGGDEFACLLPEVPSEADATRIAQHLVESLQRPHELIVGEQRVQLEVRVSIGIALYPRHGDTAEALLRAADTAMYQAKQSGSGHALAR